MEFLKYQVDKFSDDITKINYGSPERIDIIWNNIGQLRSIDGNYRYRLLAKVYEGNTCHPTQKC